MKKLAIICGGPSAERGISLNSARSLVDNLDEKTYDIHTFYFNPNLDVFQITKAEIYSNNPLDFDYKLNNSDRKLTIDQFKDAVKKMDIAFPIIHGMFGEDGQLQTILESVGVSYVGSNPTACKNTSNKFLCQEVLKNKGFFTVNSIILKKGDKIPTLPEGKYVVKPLHGGSSIGVEFFEIPGRFKDKLENVWEHEEEALIEPFVIGNEFTIIVLQNREGEPVSLLPSEIEFNSDSDKFFNYRKKYLATADTRYHTPARFEPKTIDKIRQLAEKAFNALQMKDFARLDGWLLPDGNIWFSDVNAISGTEQNSFLFQQASILGLSHSQLLDYIINKSISPLTKEQKAREAIPVIFGGDTAERQVSVISGTNVWMKLKNSKNYKPIPLFLSFEGKIYVIPQYLCLLHSVEEIEEKIEIFSNKNILRDLKSKQRKIFSRLKIRPEDASVNIFAPYETKLEEISDKYKFLFLGLHGGDGENGVFQKKLEKLGLAYNGPGPEASELCMDKYLTGQKIIEAKEKGISTAKKILLDINIDVKEAWAKIQIEKIGESVILKPRGDGCSAGVIQVSTFEQFKKAIGFFLSGKSYIPDKAIHNNHGKIHLPSRAIDEILVEDYICTDLVRIKNLEIEWGSNTDLVEVTVGVIGAKENMESFNPSQTIASLDVLSLEEKFMGGTGINLTPPPIPYVTPKIVDKCKKNIIKTAQILGITGYARIDTFLNIKTGDLKIIEANTLPALTPSTVIFQQALAQPNPMTPLMLIEKIIEIGKKINAKKISK
jgi:D-alanine--D-alanine ligase